MASNPDSYKNRYSYIPPSVQKTMDAHMQRDMPAHLQKYQQSGFVPQHAEKALSEHLKKNLPGHLQQYADAYMQQNVVWANNPEHISAPTTVPQSAAPTAFQHDARQGKEFHYDSEHPQQSGQPSLGSQGGSEGSGGEYDFIMDPENPPKRGLTLPGSSTAQRVIIGVAGLIIVIFLFTLTSSFLKKESNAQKDRLISLAQTQYEIVRVANETNNKITDKNLLYRSVTVKASVESSHNEIIAALKNRGKVKTKQINVKDPKDDTTLQDGEQNGRYDQTYAQLLQKQLALYQRQLQAVYDSGNINEKAIAKQASDQLKLLTEKSS